MVLGFISLLLTFGQSYIARICIPIDVANTMLPCKSDSEKDTSESSEEEHRRRLLWFDRRSLAAISTARKCKEVSLGQHLFISVYYHYNELLIIC